MKSLKYKIISWIFFVCCSMTLNVVSAAPTEGEISAVNVVESYLAAITVGDTQKAANFLNPSMIEKRQSLFKNPDYSLQLQKAYANSTHEIIDTKILDDGKIQVDVKISLGQQDVIHSRFTLANSNNEFLIVGEQ